MSERNLSAIRAFHEAFNAGNIDAALDLLAPDAQNHGRPVGRDGFQRTLGDIKTRFPDARLDIEQIVTTGDEVVVRCTYSGTHRGVQRMPFIDGGLMLGVLPTGKTFSVQHIHWFTLRDGLIIQHRANRDDIGMMVQLGLLTLPTPG